MNRDELQNELENRRITREVLFAAFIGPPNDSDDPRILEQLVEAISVKNIRAGDVLFREGDSSEDVYFMSEGRVRLSRAGVVDWVYEGRWVIGSADAFLGRRRNRTAVAETDIRLFTLASHHWFVANENKPESLLAALIGFGVGIGKLHSELAPDGGFAAPSTAPPIEGLDTFAGKVRFLGEHPLLRGVSAQLLVELARAAKLERFEAGALLHPRGAPPERLFLVTRGLIEIALEEPAITATFGPGALAGGCLHFHEVNASWQARALEAAEVVSLSINHLCDLLEENLEDLKVLSGFAALERERLGELLATRKGELVLR